MDCNSINNFIYLTSFDYRPWAYPIIYAKAEGASTDEIRVPTQVETGKITIETSVRATFQLE